MPLEVKEMCNDELVSGYPFWGSADSRFMADGISLFSFTVATDDDDALNIKDVLNLTAFDKIKSLHAIGDS